jgi:hypothetical protein
MFSALAWDQLPTAVYGAAEQERTALAISL